jgi:ATP-dependent Zn protease
LKVHLKNKNHNLKQLDITKAATMMDGWTGAEIYNVVNLAAIATVR